MGSIDLGDLAAVVALLLSAYSIWTTNSFNKRQKAFIEKHDRLNQLLIERESAESKAQLKADVSANFVKTGKSRWTLKVFNRGRGTARNVRLTELGDAGMLSARTVAEKFPLPILEQHQSVELLVRVHLQSATRTHIKLEWDDDAGKDWSKELTPTI